MATRTFLRTLAAASFGAVLAFSSSAHAETSTGPASPGQSFVFGPMRGVTDPVIYDSATGGTFTTTGTSPRTYIGGAANIAGAGPQADITSLDVFMFATTAVSYTNIRARIQFWDTYTAAASPIFSNPVGSPIVIDLGPVTTVANSVSTISITLPAPLRLNSLAGKGFAVNFQGDTGAGLADTADLVSAMSHTAAMAVGTSAVGGGNGFYRNVANQTTFNFSSTELRTFAGITDVRTSLRLRGVASVPVMLQSFDVK